MNKKRREIIGREFECLTGQLGHTKDKDLRKNWRKQLIHVSPLSLPPPTPVLASVPTFLSTEHLCAVHKPYNPTW